MARRPLLPLLEPHRDALEKCVYCPKLSRAACPVSNVEASETVTPWGKMSLTYFAGRGDIALTAETAETSWACSACYGCRERCDHRNPVADVLIDQRAEMFAQGLAPEAATRIAAAYSAREQTHRAAVDNLDAAPSRNAKRGLLIGCSYVRHAQPTAEAAIRLARRWLGDEVHILQRCCGLPLRYAGDRHGFDRAARAFVSGLGDTHEIAVADPGCAHTLLNEYGARLKGRSVRPLVDVAIANIHDITALAIEGRALRYHDPCQLGRGLGRYEEPRALLARITGQAPAEFQRHRESAECSGGGGLLSVTRPTTAEQMADARLAEHRGAKDAMLVTGCGESLRRFRSRGQPVSDWIDLVDEAIPRASDER
jgi:Fe-S oxidoreductase